MSLRSKLWSTQETMKMNMNEYELGGELGSGHMNMSFTCNIAPFHKEHSPPPHNAQPTPEIKNIHKALKLGEITAK